MGTTVAENAARVLEYLVGQGVDVQIDGATLSAGTGLSPEEVNNAATILAENGFVELLRFLGTAPFTFGIVMLTARGLYEYEQTHSNANAHSDLRWSYNRAFRDPVTQPLRPLSPIGSPYGFTDEDWEAVTSRRSAPDVINVVMGFQWKSSHYDAELLKANIEAMFRNAVGAYNKLPLAPPVTLSFAILAAGYGEHLFNEIARDIIASDIAVFDTSDLNPNVMIEIGVALTWGVRVLVVKEESCPKPPSDISGHTWADYLESGATFTDSSHGEKLVRMVERAARKKGRT